MPDSAFRSFFKLCLTVASLSALACLSLGVPNANAAEDADTAALRKIRLSLQRYDLEKTATYEALDQLGAIAKRTKLKTVQREARFLRAAVAVDLLVIAQRAVEPRLGARVLAIWDKDPDRALKVLSEELRSLGTGAYAATVRDGQNALQALAEKEPRWDWLQHGSGTRHDVMYLAAARSIVRDHTNLAAGLARLGVDPCPTPEAKCPAIYAHFDEPSRKAMAALDEAMTTIGRLSKAASGGDPLPAALSDVLNDDLSAITAVSLRLLPGLPKETALTTVPRSGLTEPVDMIILVGPQSLSYGFSSVVRAYTGKGLEASAKAEPALPQTKSLPFGDATRPILKSIDSLTSALEKMEPAPSTLSVAVAVSPDAPSNLISRVLLTLQRFKISDVRLLGKTKEGALVFAKVRIEREAQSKSPATAEARVTVRLGGYALVRAGQPSETIPRVRGEDNKLHFDGSALSSKLTKPPKSASVTFTGDVSAESVIVAAFALLPSTEPVHLVVR